MSPAEGHRFGRRQRGNEAGQQDSEDGWRERDDRPLVARNGGPSARGSNSSHRELRNLTPRIGADTSAGRKDESILYCAGPMLNPLRSEAEMFRLLIYVIVVFAVIIALILILRAIF
jgi:hypothetical protein